jgi:1-acyl-sn-glycerol-3-phosphate acyltransferase
VWVITFSAVIVLVIYFGHKASKVDWGGPAVNWVDGLVRLLCKYVHRLAPTEIALPNTGAAIVVANHVSGLDPFLLIAACRRPLRFLIAREEYERPLLHWLFKASGCIPVDRGGRPEQALRQALRALKQGEVVAIFPHGKIHLDTDPPRKIKGGVARLAAWSGAPIYSVRIDGVGGQGQIFFAPIIPSHAILSLKEIRYCQTDQLTDCLAFITKAIETPVITGD